MPDIPIGAQVFDLVFHPTLSIVYTADITGGVKSFSYNEEGQHCAGFSQRPSKRSCRGLALDEGGTKLWAIGKNKALYTFDTGTGQLLRTQTRAHDSSINCIKYLTPRLLSTGDDNGVIKLWDPRGSDALRSYGHHSDFISDFLWLEDEKQLVATSGDCTLSVMDVRAGKTEPLVQSDDQEDELLSILSIKGGTKCVVGTQLGILSIFNKSMGWRDCADRVLGHPNSVDSLCALPSTYRSDRTILTGSSDGLVRAVQLFPTNLVGVVTDHGDFPVERIAVELGGQGRWVGSVGHDEILKLTDVKVVFDGGDVEESEGNEMQNKIAARKEESFDGTEEDQPEYPADASKKRKRKYDKDLLGTRKNRGHEANVERSFFADL